MLQWFNKQEDSSSSSPEQEGNRQHSPLSASGLTEEDYEFLFNQLLDGVAHGWHLGRIIKFFNNLESRSNLSQWLAWLERFEQKIVYSPDPSKRRVGAIMMRFSELTQSSLELQELGRAFQRIGKKLFIGDTTELIWEYGGLDRVIEEVNSPEDEVTAITLEANLDSILESTDIPDVATLDLEEEVINQNLDELLDLTAESTSESENIALTDSAPEIVNQAFAEDLDSTSKVNSPSEEIVSQLSKEETQGLITEEQQKSKGEFTAQPTQSPDFVPEPEFTAEHAEPIADDKKVNSSIESLDALTKQLTVLQDATPEPENNAIAKQSQELLTKSEEALPLQDGERLTKFTEQPTQSPDFVPEPKPPEEQIRLTEGAGQKTNPVESLEALTEQLTVLHDTIEEETEMKNEADTELELDAETISITPETENATSATSLSVASFLEATKTLVPQKKERSITPLTWEEFIAVLEQDQTLAQQVAQYLQISSTNPQDIVQAAVNRLSKQEETRLSPATIELVESWFNLGLKQASAEDFQGAITSWEKALKLNPNLSEAWHNRGSALGRLGKYEEAIQSFNRAIKIVPERYQAWNDRAHALYQVQKWEQAVESWDKAISIMSDNYQFWYNRGCALEQIQRYDESISSYEKALEIKPDFQPARSRYINLITENSSSPAN